MEKINGRNVLILLLILLLTACQSYKKVPYLQDAEVVLYSTQNEQLYDAKIMPKDLLTIVVSCTSPELAAPFNLTVATQSNAALNYTTTQPVLQQYLVDNDGNINFPVLGKIHVAGLSKQELCDELQSKLSKYIENPLVNVQITNYRITVMGEVNRPGTFTIKNDRISILDAFGYVGDLAITANRKNIWLIRDNDGQKEFVRMDITDPSLFTSPYFYLRQNDVIYVEPNLAKQRNSRFSQSKQYNITVFSSIISAISVISSMVITIINIKK